MGWFKRNIGLEWFDVFLHAGVTAMLMAFVGMQGDEEVIPAVIAASLIALGFRRHFALKRAPADPEGLSSGQMAALRFEELEQRMADLEHAQSRVAELEERLDFTERLLARVTEPAKLPGAEGSDG